MLYKCTIFWILVNALAFKLICLVSVSTTQFMVMSDEEKNEEYLDIEASYKKHKNLAQEDRANPKDVLDYALAEYDNFTLDKRAISEVAKEEKKAKWDNCIQLIKKLALTLETQGNIAGEVLSKQGNTCLAEATQLQRSSSDDVIIKIRDELKAKVQIAQWKLDHVLSGESLGQSI